MTGKLLPCPEPPEELLRDIPAAVQCGSRAAFVQNCEALFAWFVEREIRDATFIRMCVLRLCYSILKNQLPICR